MNTLRWILDILIAFYTLIVLYYIGLLIFSIKDVLTFLYNAIGGDPFSTDYILFKYLFIVAIIVGIHIILSIWMYADFSKRTFTTNSQRVFWLTALVAGFSPIYYFAQGRKPLK